MSSVVLLVDDDENFALLVRQAFLKAWPDASLQTVNDGKCAIEYLLGDSSYADRRRFPVPSLILLDLNMPRVDGFQVLSWKREIPALNSLPVVVWSSSDLPENAQRAGSLGAAAYLVKPMGLDDYIEVVKHLKNFSALPPAIRTSPWVWSALSNVVQTTQ
jgi:CheY-like chemotaxis protein